MMGIDGLWYAESLGFSLKLSIKEWFVLRFFPRRVTSTDLVRFTFVFEGFLVSVI